MRAARYHQYGPPGVVVVEEVPDPVRGPGEVLVAVEAAGLNPADTKVRRGATPVAPLPSGIGREFAGTVLEAGPRSNLAPGDLVIGTSEWVIGERVCVDEGLLASRPAALDVRVAATLPVAAQTAYVACATQSVGPGDVVLVSAAAGGVGFIAAQRAVALGARVVGTAGERNHDRLREVGVEPVTYGPGLVDRLRGLVPDGIDVVLDHHGQETIEAALELGVPRERINTISGYAAWYAVASEGRRGMDRALVERIAADVVGGRLQVPVEAAYPLEEIVAAYERLETGHLLGKVVVVL